MTPRSAFSPQALSVLATLSDRPSAWRHGHDAAKETGLKSGTLYPILIRLADRADCIAAVVMLAGLALLARRCFGPVAARGLPRTIRAGAYGWDY